MPISNCVNCILGIENTKEEILMDEKRTKNLTAKELALRARQQVNQEQRTKFYKPYEVKAHGKAK